MSRGATAASRALCSLVMVVAGVLISSCGPEPYPPCTREDALPGQRFVCPMAGEVDRAFTLHVPDRWDGESPLPLLVVLHGGGGNRTGMEALTCEDGSAGDSSCLQHHAVQAGVAVVFPDGHGNRPVRNVRTWNAGGSTLEWGCVAGAACRERVDDVGYLDAVLSHVGELLPLAPGGVHAAGFSNGAAMAFRWSCERPDSVDTVVAVGGMNQHGVSGGACAGHPRVLQVHGFSDPCWRWSTSSAGCVGADRPNKAGVEESMMFWQDRLGCVALPAPQDTVADEASEDAGEAPSQDAEGEGSEGVASEAADSREEEADEEPWRPDATLAESREEEGTVEDEERTATWYRFHGCERDLLLLALDRAGHVWPDGYQYTSSGQVGRPFRGLDFNARLVEFLLASEGDWP